MSNSKGSLLIEFMVSVTIFTAAVASLSLLTFQVSESVALSELQVEALGIAESKVSEKRSEMMEGFDYRATSTDSSEDTGIFNVGTSVVALDNFMRKITATVSFAFKNRTISLPASGLFSDIGESEGQSSCRPSGDPSSWESISSSSFDLEDAGGLINLEDVDVVGNYSYAVSNTSSSTDHDFFIVDHSDISDPHIVSSLDTGPGALSLHVAGNYAYLANTSVNAQLQIIDISDRADPRVLTSFKLPGNYNDNTTIGNSVFYKSGKVYLGTQKSMIEELHVIDVSSAESPFEIANYEIGGAVNDVLAFKEWVYAATAGQGDIMLFNLGESGLELMKYFNPPGSLVNGKRLSLFLDRIYPGRTVGNDEVHALSAYPYPFFKFYRFTSGSSVHGIFAYDDLLFLLLNKTSDAFRAYDISGSAPSRIPSSPVSFPSNPLNFDCDKSLFAVVSDQSSVITYIYPSYDL